MTTRPITQDEERRLKMLREAGPNTWLALDQSQSRCVGKGPTLEAAIADAHRNGYDEPVMFRVPSDWTPAVLSPCA